MQKLLTRNSLLLWIGLIATVITYLQTADGPPNTWTYDEWLNAAAFLAAWGLGKLQSSPLPSASELEYMERGGVERRS